MTRPRATTWALLAPLFVAGLGAVAACSLNPQPLPPDTADTGYQGPSGSTADSGASKDGAHNPPPHEDAGGGSGEAGGESDGSFEAGSDGEVDASNDAPLDGESDADAGVEAGDSGEPDGEAGMNGDGGMP